mgnify:CR=1 FL=1
MSETIKKELLHLSSKTWLKDSNGLFDYESKQTKNLKAFIGQSLCITRKGFELNGSKKFICSENEETLFKIIKSKNSIYTIDNKVQNNLKPTESNISKLNNKIWYKVNYEQKVNFENKNINKDYYLSKNDIIKLGRVKYILNEVNFISGENKDNLIIPSEKNYINEVNSKAGAPFDLIYEAKCLEDEIKPEKDNEEKQLCKICYTDETDNDNPMVHLCNCKGGLNYAHFNCIKQWMKTKLIVFENQKKTVKSYFIRGFNCEICKTPYPLKFKLNNNEKIFTLIDVEKPINANYIILESLNQIKENNNIKSIHVMSLNDDEEIIIGRGHDCDVKIKDISVSRHHSKLIFNINQKTLLIKDLKSKFGTLVLIKTPFEIREAIQIQIGRTFIKTSLLSFQDLKNYQKILEIEKKLKNIRKEEFFKNENNNNYEQLETEYKEKNVEKKNEENNKMNIDEQ